MNIFEQQKRHYPGYEIGLIELKAYNYTGATVYMICDEQWHVEVGTITKNDKKTVGYKDGEYYYFWPQVLYKCLVEYYENRGGMPETDTYQAVMALLSYSWDVKGLTIEKINGKKTRCLKVPIGKIEGCADDSERIQNKTERVNHPAHYNREGAMECIDEMELVFGVEEAAIFCKLNAWKYRYRAGEKDDGTTDLKKSDWYLKKFRELTEKLGAVMEDMKK